MIGDGQTSLQKENVGEMSCELEHEKKERGEETGVTKTPQDSRDQSGETSMVLPPTKTRDSDTFSESSRRMTFAADGATKRYQTNLSTTSTTGTSQGFISTEPLRTTETGTIVQTVITTLGGSATDDGGTSSSNGR